ncbi:MAG: GNAT family N-acetyltransferase [Planctomycetota bacterium]
MVMTYFRRFRMEMPLDDWQGSSHRWGEDEFAAQGYRFVPFDEDLIRAHAQAKFQSFRDEMDANVFPCLARRDGCLRLMREITQRASFVPGATWLLEHCDRPHSRSVPVGTIQGLQQDDWGSIQNLGVSPEHRGRGLGAALLRRAAAGFRSAGMKAMHLEVTTENTSAIRLYERFGFHQAKVVYKACEIASGLPPR